MSDFAHFEIETEANGASRVVVNGADLSDQVHGLVLQAVRGQPPILRLDHVAASGPIEGDGIVQVLEEGLDQRQAVLAFLENLDGEQLEEAATDMMSMASDARCSNMGEAFLLALKQAAGG
jgi:hypothetical protein